MELFLRPPRTALRPGHQAPDEPAFKNPPQWIHEAGKWLFSRRRNAQTAHPADRPDRPRQEREVIPVSPIGSTMPRRLISPVIATSLRTGTPVSSEASAVNIATPALGPSLGVAPAGTWTWRSLLLEEMRGSRPSCSTRDHDDERRLRRLLHHVAELAGEDQLALARHRVASMKRMSPPTGVHARPVATPGTLVRSATSPRTCAGRGSRQIRPRR